MSLEGQVMLVSLDIMLWRNAITYRMGILWFELDVIRFNREIYFAHFFKLELFIIIYK